jgi:hypothetical protein
MSFTSSSAVVHQVDDGLCGPCDVRSIMSTWLSILYIASAHAKQYRYFILYAFDFSYPQAIGAHRAQLSRGTITRGSLSRKPGLPRKRFLRNLKLRSSPKTSDYRMRSWPASERHLGALQIE